MTQRSHCQQPDACKAKSHRHCRACSLATLRTDPAWEARRCTRLAEANRDPEHCAAISAGIRRVNRQRAGDPAWRELKRRQGEHGAKNFWRCNTAEAREKAAKAIRAAHLAWCPEEFWPLNQKLKRQQVRLPERKAIIGKLIAEKSLANYDHEAAAFYLRRLTSVMRCDVAGRLDPAGTHWRYGSRVLERVEVVQLALSKGWQPMGLAA